MREFVIFLVSMVVGLGGEIRSGTSPSAGTPTPTPISIQSIFAYDTCNPPCWMGLIPGESNSDDVQAMFKNNTKLIVSESIDGGASRLANGDYALDAATGQIITGAFSFDVGEPKDQEGPLVSRSRIDIENGKVNLLVIVSNEPISLRHILERMGQPTVVRLDFYLPEKPTLKLIYPIVNTIIYLSQTALTCRTSGILDTMLFENILNYAPDAAIRVEKLSPDMPAQTLLTGYGFLTERDVPPDVWESWLSGDADQTCYEAWSQLNEPEIIPNMTSTPVASATPS